MIRRYIKSFKCCFPDQEADSGGVNELVQDIPKRAARRMSLLGKQMHHVLADVNLDLDTSIVYGTTYTEARALETFLDSIPFASPTAFQTSIHPGGIEQAMILRRLEAASLFPLAGEKTLFPQMLQTALTSKAPKSIILGGEESGTWLKEFNLAYPRLFAFSLEIADESPDNSIGMIAWDNDHHVENPKIPSLEEAVREMQRRATLSFGSPDHGQFTISWK